MKFDKVACRQIEGIPNGPVFSENDLRIMGEITGVHFTNNQTGTEFPFSGTTRQQMLVAVRNAERLLQDDRLLLKFCTRTGKDREDVVANLEKISSVGTFLKFGKLSRPDKKIKDLAVTLRGKSNEETLQNIIKYVCRFPYYDQEGNELEKWKTTFLQRSAKQIFKSHVSYGCDDHAIIFSALARELGFPTKHITAKRLGKSGMHAWPQVFVENQWVDINATTGEKPFDYTRAVHGPYKILSESLDPADSVMKNYQDWRDIEKKFEV